MIDESSAIYQIYLRNFTLEGTFAAALPELRRVADLGCDWVCLTPIHPIGIEARKGSMGSPYAIADYRAIDPELGTIDDFRAFLAAAHDLGVKVMMDVVYNHTSPDSVLAREHPEWFMQEGKGPAASRGELEDPAPGSRLGRKCEDWSDVVDFDYSSSPELWMELISTLAYWRDQGVDGFRCDVASLVPLDFWKQARQRVNQYDPGTRRERYPLVWLAESVHPAFLKKMRESGYGAWSEPELHAVFDLTYDYDGWERLEAVWAGRKRADFYLDYLYVQETLYPKGAKKLRFLENHDQERAAGKFVTRSRFMAWTAMMYFVPGVAFVYMGQEFALEHRPNLFEKDPVDWASGDSEFREWFGKVLAFSKKAKREAPYFSWKDAGKGHILLERPAVPGARKPSFVAFVNLEGWKSGIVLQEPVCGFELLSGERICLESGNNALEDPLILSMED
ncbi:MAG: alpha-amylase family glycosyl hydrolase [Spirochaetes bacterium]|nr:alpha-amylase family glycosyl hydrolase [Spirochaetota bacterium]